MVLILILMEHAQRDVDEDAPVQPEEACLNPYFNGTCSKSILEWPGMMPQVMVLILILMEHAQRAISISRSALTRQRLNPYFNGTCSKRYLNNTLLF